MLVHSRKNATLQGKEETPPPYFNDTSVPYKRRPLPRGEWKRAILPVMEQRPHPAI